ncbi:MAG: SprT-like domain-containing protein [Anaerolineaceae bacterium]|nr:SprT-like domain-containing protein [Anaerolineaceae bacterium]
MKKLNLRIPNLRTSVDSIHASIYQLVLSKTSNLEFKASEGEISALHVQICSLLSSIDTYCTERSGSPADLSTSSFRIYLWLKFLSHQPHLTLHLSALDEFLQIIIKYIKKACIDPRRLLIKINYSGYLYRRQTIENKTILQINEVYIITPFIIKKSILSAAFLPRQSKPINAIKTYSKSPEFRHMNKLICGDPIANHISCRGEKYDLSILFNKINKEYFHSQLPQPRLVWSSRRSKRRLGYYHPEINTIALTRKLDDNKSPRLLVEYILYHEMLHQHFGIKHLNGRRYAHTSEFRIAEKKFKHQKEAENLIKHYH